MALIVVCTLHLVICVSGSSFPQPNRDAILWLDFQNLNSFCSKDDASSIYAATVDVHSGPWQGTTLVLLIIGFPLTDFHRVAKMEQSKFAKEG